MQEKLSKLASTVLLIIGISFTLAMVTIYFVDIGERNMRYSESNKQAYKERMDAYVKKIESKRVAP